ncbi:MAG TPA: signal peptidase I [Phototrophicaceae bacterium]|nr:signal peptidase I [Phototrophicaceae bacterium]
MSTAVLTAARHRAERTRTRRRHGVLRTVLHHVLRGVVLLALLAVLAALVVVPRVLGWAPLTVLTGSMEPTVPTGSQVVVAPVDDVAALEVGDVITVMPFPDDLTLVTHRVVARTDTADGPSFVTQGDANDVADAWEVTETQIRGEVRYWLPVAGHVATALSGHTKALGLVLIALALLGYAGAQLVAVARERRAAGTAPVVDRSRLDRLGAEVGEDAARGMVDRFVDLLPGRVARLKEAATSGGAPELRDASLSLGNPAAMLGADRLAEVAATLRAADTVLARQVLTELDELAEATERELAAGR